MQSEQNGKVPTYLEEVFGRIDTGITAAVKEHEQVDNKLLPNLKPLFTEMLRQVQQRQDEHHKSLLLDRSIIQQTEDGTTVIGMTVLNHQGILVQVIASRGGGLIEPLFQKIGGIDEFVGGIDSVDTLANLVGAVFYQIRDSDVPQHTAYR